MKTLSCRTGVGWGAAQGAGKASDAKAAPWWQALTLSELLGQHARVSCQRPWLVRAARLLWPACEAYLLICQECFGVAGPAEITPKVHGLDRE